MRLGKKASVPFWRTAEYRQSQESMALERIRHLEREQKKIREEQAFGTARLRTEIKGAFNISRAQEIYLALRRISAENPMIRDSITPEIIKSSMTEMNLYLLSHPNFQDLLKELYDMQIKYQQAEQKKIETQAELEKRKFRTQRGMTIAKGLAICVAALGMSGAYIGKAWYDRKYLQPTLEKIETEIVSARTIGRKNDLEIAGELDKEKKERIASNEDLIRSIDSASDKNRMLFDERVSSLETDYLQRFARLGSSTSEIEKRLNKLDAYLVKLSDGYNSSTTNMLDQINNLKRDYSVLTKEIKSCRVEILEKSYLEKRLEFIEESSRKIEGRLIGLERKTEGVDTRFRSLE